MKRIDTQRLLALKEKYLRRRYTDETDIEIISRWESGESVTSLSREYHRSASSIYNLRERVLAFLDDPSDDVPFAYEDFLSKHIEIPMPLLPCVLECDSESMFELFRLSIGLYLEGQDFIPRWVLATISTSLGRKAYTLDIIRKMEALGVDTGLLFRIQIYDTLNYDRGIRFRFTDITKAIIDSYPQALLLRDEACETVK